MSVGTFSHSLKQPNMLHDRSKVSLESLTSRDHRFLSLYNKTTGRASKIHHVEIVAEATSLEISVVAVGRANDRSVVEKCFGWPEGTQVSSRTSMRRLPFPNHYVRLEGSSLNDLKPLLPATQYVGGDGMFIIEDFENGDRLSELLRTFLLSYFLGMLVRYYPSRWISLLRNEKGDSAQPILLSAVNAIEDEYPILVAGALS
ncbi:hypothetical protein PGA2_c07380 [Phaeobacter inhibens 2.10]|nr:hypothetical protein PGA2_c07380 [Phaeobacter inhibens 2.10]